MAYSEELAERMRAVVGLLDGIAERKMFGGVAWMLNGHLAVGTYGDAMLVRLAREDVEAALAEPHVGPMAFSGRSMRGFVTVGAAAVEDDEQLARWIDAGAAYAASLPAK
jgi:TfoX/Sxy family transcriptional regulator of competence genes